MEKKETVLVTGGTGFVGVHTILQLLREGYKVRTTIRNLNRKDDVYEMLKNAGISTFDDLDFVAADLTKDDNWQEAAEGCTYVLHIASPFPPGQSKNEDELIIPAKEGTLRVLRAARNAGVKKLVLTSSFAAVGYSIDPENHVFTEDDWTDPTANIPPYIKSKTLAELAAWDFIKNEGGALQLSVINPVGIFGPVLGKDFSSSIQMMQQLMSGKMPGSPQLSFGMVDVRDVADIHIRAMKSSAANGQRFLAASDGTTSLPEIAKFLHSQHSSISGKVPTRVLPNWVVKIAACFKPELRSLSAQLGIVKVLSNDKAKAVLGWNPRAKEETILDTAESLIRFGLIEN